MSSDLQQNRNHRRQWVAKNTAASLWSKSDASAREYHAFQCPRKRLRRVTTLGVTGMELTARPCTTPHPLPGCRSRFPCKTGVSAIGHILSSIILDLTTQLGLDRLKRSGMSHQRAISSPEAFRVNAPRAHHGLRLVSRLPGNDYHQQWQREPERLIRNHQTRRRHSSASRGHAPHLR